MKNLLSAIILLIIFLLVCTGCTVNSSTGIIHIENRSSEIIKNIKIGGLNICWEIDPGAKYDYYFYSEINGKLTAEGATTGYREYYLGDYHDEVKLKGTYTLELNNWYSCRITEQDDEVYIQLFQSEQGGDYYEDTDDDFYDD